MKEKPIDKEFAIKIIHNCKEDDETKKNLINAINQLAAKYHDQFEEVFAYYLIYKEYVHVLVSIYKEKALLFINSYAEQVDKYIWNLFIVTLRIFNDNPKLFNEPTYRDLLSYITDNQKNFMNEHTEQCKQLVDKAINELRE